MLILTKLKSDHGHTAFDLVLPLTAEERRRSRYRLILENHQEICWRLSRGKVLHHGDMLADESETTWIKIVAKPEPVLTVVGTTPIQLLRAAYHLGNRHVPVELTTDYLRLSPDLVLQSMLQKLQLEVTEEVAPFYPELGAYGDHHSHE
ncbi:urease accessory protein UreE [Cylindrospermopsis curvispora]|uniref:Urease accessory protein UreE n=1 Tax=Cylindrospermopsis curvispora GIHE-G1 TaxID=2666332 RepID=A0A7H0F169_9CYAN|nr:urease accessory protein UreE [Cylindrospermopsis curvispora]QNP29785.1 urease accessory protein UreE [Cylindrospermopsis curvispora GIHE-G1]